MRTLVLIFCLGFVFNLPARVRAASVNEDYSQREKDFREKLTAIADDCQAQQLEREERITRQWRKVTPGDQLRLYLPSSPRDLATEDPLAELDAAWRAKFLSARSNYAEAIFALAHRAAAEKEPALAWQLAHETLRENPDHEAARKLLGYLKFRGIWCTPFVRDQLVAGKSWHAAFGWLPKGHAKRYEEGERFGKSGWTSREADEREHFEISRGWKIHSEHFVVTTNHSLEYGVRLSEQLERLHTVWRQLFIGYLATASDVQKWFAGNATRPKSEIFQVICFRNRQEYNAQLLRDQPQIEMTIGIYLDGRRTAYFFAGDEQTENSVQHEGTHQLFQESRTTKRQVAQDANAWIVEGIAGYMESWRDDGDAVLLGGYDEGRMPAARKRLLDDNFYVPLAELTRLGLPQLKADPQIAKLYSQSTGLATFLMHAEHGKYRRPLVGYLQDVYVLRSDETSFSKDMDMTLSDLDLAYRRFCESPPQP